jgi:hypothetical protein
MKLFALHRKVILSFRFPHSWVHFKVSGGVEKTYPPAPIIPIMGGGIPPIIMTGCIPYGGKPDIERVSDEKHSQIPAL